MAKTFDFSRAAAPEMSSHADVSRDEHYLVLISLGLHFVACGVIAMTTQTSALWLAVGVPAFIFPAWLILQYPAAILSRLAASTSAMAFTLLGVQQTSGYMEAHFSFFVMITVIAVYRDWRLLIFAAALVIIHHVGYAIFDPVSIGFYVENDRFGPWRHVISHISVGLMQVFTLCYLTIMLKRREALNAALGSSLDIARERANYDQLTGLFNRNYLEDAIARLSAGVQDGSDTAVICVFDIDHFKSVNDRYGHAGGDDVLRAVAGTVRSQLRTGDFAVRQGGEEFLVVLPGSNIEDGRHFAERLRGQVALQVIPFMNSRLSVTISGGVAAWGRSEHFEEVFKRADKQLYAAKMNGRNRVEIYRSAGSTAIAKPLAFETTDACRHFG